MVLLAFPNLEGIPSLALTDGSDFTVRDSKDHPTFIIDGEEIPHTGYNTDLLANYVEQFLDDKDDRPWALCLWYKAPHGPFTPPTRYVQTYVDVQLQSPPTLNASTDGKPRSLQTEADGT